MKRVIMLIGIVSMLFLFDGCEQGIGTDSGPEVLDVEEITAELQRGDDQIHGGGKDEPDGEKADPKKEDRDDEKDDGRADNEEPGDDGEYLLKKITRPDGREVMKVSIQGAPFVHGRTGLSRYAVNNLPSLQSPDKQALEDQEVQDESNRTTPRPPLVVQPSADFAFSQNDDRGINGDLEFRYQSSGGRPTYTWRNISLGYHITDPHGNVVKNDTLDLGDVGSNLRDDVSVRYSGENHENLTITAADIELPRDYSVTFVTHVTAVDSSRNEVQARRAYTINNHNPPPTYIAPTLDKVELAIPKFRDGGIKWIEDNDRGMFTILVLDKNTREIIPIASVSKRLKPCDSNYEACEYFGRFTSNESHNLSEYDIYDIKGLRFDLIGRTSDERIFDLHHIILHADDLYAFYDDEAVERDVFNEGLISVTVPIDQFNGSDGRGLRLWMPMHFSPVWGPEVGWESLPIDEISYLRIDNRIYDECQYAPGERLSCPEGSAAAFGVRGIQVPGFALWLDPRQETPKIH
ncbi:MAG: hypothetical protein HN337_03065 [Deltaproteobacteria bacterium]|jgi:hypothetical protein|nr:hypothetical protein [Deltaproteobacteria bacterium]